MGRLGLMNGTSIVFLLLCVVWLPSWAPGQENDSPKTALELFQAGRAAYGRGDFTAAQIHFEQFLQDYGDAAEAQDAARAVRPLLAICLIRTRSFEAAQEAIDRAVEDSALEIPLRRELFFWKGVCEMEAGNHAAAQMTFGTYYQETPASEPRRGEAAVLFGTAYLLQNQLPEAIEFFAARIEDYETLSPELAARFMTLQLHALLETGRLDEAVALTLRAAERFDQFAQIIGLQSLILELGARLLEGERYYEAIRCLHYVWPQERLLHLQKGRQERLQKRRRSLDAQGDADAVVFQLDGILTRIQRELEHFAQVEEYDAALRMRLAGAYLGLQRYREAALIMEEMLLRMAPGDIVEKAALTLVQCWMQEERWDRAARAADLYLERFGEDAANGAFVLFLKGQAWQSARQYDEALSVFQRCLSHDPDGALAARASFMRGICHLQLDRYEEAVAVFGEVRVAYPEEDSLVESALYWEGMAHSFAGSHGRCLEMMQQHEKEYAAGAHRGDAAFRLAFSQHALADYEAAIPSFHAFLKRHPENAYVDEARLLLGDAHLARGALEEGMKNYAAISPDAVKFYEEGYFKTGKALKLSERFTDMEAHFRAFVDTHSASARLPEALHWLAWLKHREGDLEEARRLYWKALDDLGDEPAMHSVLDLVSGLQKLYPGPERAALIAGWEERRQRALRQERSTYAVRSLWAKAQAMAQSQPVQSAVLLTQARSQVRPEVHSARLLVDVADALWAMESWSEAAGLYADIVKWHPNALERDRAEAGLGHEAMRVQDHALAWKHFSRLEKRHSGSIRLGEILLAKAECEKTLGDREEALETLETLLADQSISSEAKAEALLRSGQWLEEARENEKALVYFERVYLVYGRYAERVATAYWSRGQLLEKLGEVEKALELYRELLSREELQSHPEYALAQARVDP